MFKIIFQSKSTQEIELEQESTLLAAAATAGTGLNHRCGGHARCGTCKVTILEGAEQLSEMGPAEKRILKILKAAPDQRLACQTWAKADCSCKV